MSTYVFGTLLIEDVDCGGAMAPALTLAADRSIWYPPPLMVSAWGQRPSR